MRKAISITIFAVLTLCVTLLAADDPARTTNQDALSKEMRAAALHAHGAISRHMQATPADSDPALNTEGPTYRDKEKAMEDARLAMATDADHRVFQMLQEYERIAGLSFSSGRAHKCTVAIYAAVDKGTLTQADTDASGCFKVKKK